MYQIIPNRKIWLSVSGAIVGISLLALILWGLNFGIDFTGGALLEVEYKTERPTTDEVKAAMKDLELGNYVVQPIGEKGMIIRFQDISEAKHQAALKSLNEITEITEDTEANTEDTDENTDGADANAEDTEANTEGTDENTESTEEITDGADATSSTEGENVEEADSADTMEEVDISIGEEGTVEVIEAEAVEPEQQYADTDVLEELRYDSVGPTIGAELKSKSVTAMVIVLLAIVLYIAWAFRKVSKPVASWKYGLSAIVALFHDVIITLGIFAVLGEFFGIEVNTAFVAAILTVLGYSVNDTIVVFDRIRENLPKSDEDFEGTVNLSVNQTIQRSINTSVTTLLVLLSILFFGGASIRDFVLALSIGVFVGTYSSIFLASPVLVVWEKLRKI